MTRSHVISWNKQKFLKIGWWWWWWGSKSAMHFETTRYRKRHFLIAFLIVPLVIALGNLESLLWVRFKFKKYTIDNYRLLILDFFYDASVFIMKKLTREEVRLLCNLPPFLCSYNDIVIKYFGENPPDAAWEFLCTSLQLRVNLKFIKRRRRVEKQSLTMPSSSSTRDSI